MEQVFLKILNMSITAGYCALAVMIIRLLLKKQPKVYSYALWLIVAFRLLCPVSFESVFSLMRISPETIPTDIVDHSASSVATGIGGVDVVVNQALKVVTAPEVQDASTSVAKQVDSPLQTIIFAGSILWLVVAAVFLGYGIGSYMRMRQELRDAKETEAGIFLSERLKTPFVLGYFKPQIYLPEGLSSAEKAYVVEHERTHIRRGDHVVKMGAFLLMSLHWFNPVLWVSFFLMCKDMEMSCDEKVVKKLSAGHVLDTKKDYASTLLALASNHQFSFGGPLAFGEGNIKKRISNVLQYKKSTMAVSAVLVVIVVVVVLLFIGNPKSDKETGGTPNKNTAENITATTKPSPTISPTTAPIVTEVTGTPIPTNATAPAGIELLFDENGKRIYYGVVEDAVIENEYFSLEIPKECINAVSYLLELKQQENGGYGIESLNFYLKKDSEDRTKLEMVIEADKGLRNTGRWLKSYVWVELKDYLEDDALEDFEYTKQYEFVFMNEAGTGGMVERYPLDNFFSGTAESQRFDSTCRALTEVDLTMKKLPQTAYTEAEMEKYCTWQLESLGTELQPNVYYAEITDRWIVTPYFSLSTPIECENQVSYLLFLEEKEDGTRAVNRLQFFYAAETEPREVFLREPETMEDFFVKSSWLGGIGWNTVDEYTEMVPKENVIDWVDRTGSVSIRKLEPLYLAEAAPFGREFVWVNAEETGAYFYYLPTDIQFAREYESAYRVMQEKMNQEAYITFFAEPDAISREVYVEKLKGYLAE